MPGTRGCVPVVRHTPTNCDSGSRAGLGRCASGPIGVVTSRMFPDTAGWGRRQRFEGTEGGPPAEAPRERTPSRRSGTLWSRSQEVVGRQPRSWRSERLPDNRHAAAIASGRDRPASQAPHRAGSASAVGQNAELVTLGVGEAHPGHVALPDVSTRCPEVEQALDLSAADCRAEDRGGAGSWSAWALAPSQREDQECGPASVGSRSRRERRSR